MLISINIHEQQKHTTIPIFSLKRPGLFQCCSCAGTLLCLSPDSAKDSKHYQGGLINTVGWYRCLKYMMGAELSRTHYALATHHLQQVQQFGAITEIIEKVHDHTRWSPLSQQ